MTINCILVDDEPLNIKNLNILINDHFPNLEVKGTFEKAADARDFLSKVDVDLVFLDISMPVIDGFDFLNFFPEKKFEVIFITAYDEFAIKAIRAGAADYILKPIILEELKEAIGRTTELIIAKKQNLTSKTIALSYSNGKTLVKSDEILYIQGFENLCQVFLKDGRKITVVKTLKWFEEKLGNNFFRIHKSYLANLDASTKIIHNNGHQMIFENGEKLPISRRSYKAFNDRFMK